MPDRVFLMTDVVGSTRRWEAEGEAMPEALRRHDAAAATAVAEHGGEIFKHTGDGFLAAFDETESAAAAALDLMDALAAIAWPTDEPLQIRAAIHAGDAQHRDDDYFGTPVNRVARLNELAHAGQILVSGEAAAGAELALVDLGQHRLRDLEAPMDVWQLDPGTHAPLQSLSTFRHNLPPVATSFVGRATEIAAIRDLLDHHPLVTLTGVGGSGKTRLALEVAAAAITSFPGGVWLVPLVTEREGERVASNVLAALGLVVPDSGVDAMVAGLNEALDTTPALFVLDNCEHLLDDAADVAEALMYECPMVTVMATSREALAVDGERVWRVPGLGADAELLFVERARAVGVDIGDLDPVREICEALDHIPLAVELAAARAGSLGLADLKSNLDDRFLLLAGGRRSSRGRQRQQTLQAMMDWSYELLEPDEALLFRELGVFSGTFGIDSVGGVSTLPTDRVVTTLVRLVEQSLVTREGDRYKLLETVRLYALDLLRASGDLDAVRTRLLDWLVERWGVDAEFDLSFDEMAEFEAGRYAEAENILASMEWAEVLGRDHDMVSLLLTLATTWAGNPTYTRAGHDWLQRIPLPDPDQPVRHLGWLATSAMVNFSLGDGPAGVRDIKRAGAAVERIAAVDPSGESWWVWGPSCVAVRGMTHLALGDIDGAERDRALLDQFVENGVGMAWTEWMRHGLRASVAGERGDPASVGHAREAVHHARLLGDDFNLEGAKAVLARELLRHGRHQEIAEIAADQFRAPRMLTGTRFDMKAVAAIALVEVGQIPEALRVLRSDMGPLLATQAAVHRTTLLAALVVLTRRLQLDELHAEALHHLRERGPSGATWLRLLQLPDAVSSAEFDPYAPDDAVERFVRTAMEQIEAATE